MSISKRHYWTPEEDNLLQELIATKKYSYTQMAKHFNNRTSQGLRGRATNQLGLSHANYVHRLHSYDQTFFETPNPINCYVAGFYAADGYIGDNPTTRVLAISLAPEDGHQVETFKRLLKYSGNVTIDSREHTGHCDMHSLRLYGAHQITTDLEKNFGLTPKKTFRIPAPNLTDSHLQLCYLAGLLDGDGCVHLFKSTYGTELTIKYISCSNAIIQWVKSFTDSINLYCLKRRRATVKQQKGTNAYSYNISGAKAIDLVLRIQHLKTENIPILDRKWDNPELNNYIASFKIKHNLPNL